jgi:uncharacterized membrane protein
MNAAHWHLTVNHLPLIFPIVGALVLTVGFIIKSDAVKRTSFLIFIIGALASIGAMSTGEGAEEVIEQLGINSDNYIETHEEIAETFSILSYVLGAVSLFGMWVNIKRLSFSNTLNWAILAFSIAVIMVGKETGTTGGEIRHTEIRTSENPTSPNPQHKEDAEDD